MGIKRIELRSLHLADETEGVRKTEKLFRIFGVTKGIRRNPGRIGTRMGSSRAPAIMLVSNICSNNRMSVSTRELLEIVC